MFNFFSRRRRSSAAANDNSNAVVGDSNANIDHIGNLDNIGNVSNVDNNIGNVPNMVPQQQQQQLAQPRLDPRMLNRRVALSFSGHGGATQAPETFTDDDPLPADEPWTVVSSAADGVARAAGAAADDLPALSVSLTAEYAAVARGTDVDEMWCVATIEARENEDEDAAMDGTGDRREAPGQDLVLVLDRSGSMNGEKMALLKVAVRFVISELRPVDRLSLVTFAHGAQRETPLALCNAAGKAAALAALDGFGAGGGTNITNGAVAGMSVLRSRQHGPHRPCNMFLLTDGLGPLDVEALTPQLLTLECAVFSFGLGADHDANALDKIATATGGVHAYVESEAALTEIFGQALGGIGSRGGAVAVSLSLEVPPARGASLLAVHAGAFAGAEPGLSASISSVFPGETKAIPFVVRLARTDSEASAVRAVLTWYERTADGRVEGPGARAELAIARPAGTAPPDARAADPVIMMQRLRVLTVDVTAEVNRSGSGAVAEGLISSAIAKIEAVRAAYPAGELPAELALTASLIEDLRALLEMVRARDTRRVSAFSKTSCTRHGQQRSNTNASEAYTSKPMLAKKSKAMSFV